MKQGDTCKRDGCQGIGAGVSAENKAGNRQYSCKKLSLGLVVLHFPPPFCSLYPKPPVRVGLFNSVN